METSPQNQNDHYSSSTPPNDALLTELESLRSHPDEALQLVQDLSTQKQSKIRVLLRNLDCVKQRVSRIIDKIDDKNIATLPEWEADAEADELDLDEECKVLGMQIASLYEATKTVDFRLVEYVNTTRKEKRDLENSLASLTEENRDVNTLLRIALVEKEVAERSLRGSAEHKKVGLLQFAEIGLHRVGFGFLMGGGLSSDVSEDEGSSVAGKVDGGECEEKEEVVTVASTVEKLMKNLRFEITQLKQSLEESRLDNERLQSLTEKQAQKIAEFTSYINDLEEQESRLAQNIEHLMTELTRSREDVERWREACELEVVAAEYAKEEQYKETMLIREEFVKTKKSLDELNNKMKLKEKLTAAAIAAQEAAQKSLQIADRKAAELHERIEELTRQLEVADSRGDHTIRRKVRHICWPWSKVSPGGPKRRNTRRMVPEMQGLLHYRH